jgi:hypothetical protein
MSIEDKRLLEKIALSFHGKNARIKDLELEVAALKQTVKYNIEALSKADVKLMELNEK